MNQGLKRLLEGEGFRRVGKSCEFILRHDASEIKSYLFRVWLHRHGGQAEVMEVKSEQIIKRLARMEQWYSMDDLKEFFKDFQ